MTCEHLRQLEAALIDRGMKETFRGRAWENQCREWVYFDCYLPLAAVRDQFALAVCVAEHEHIGTHEGEESGFVCRIHDDGIMGHHPRAGVVAPNF